MKVTRFSLQPKFMPKRSEAIEIDSKDGHERGDS
jgi:hypothetical protein